MPTMGLTPPQEKAQLHHLRVSTEQNVAFLKTNATLRLQCRQTPLVVDTFLADMPLQIEALQVLLESGDAPASMRDAHSIKGAAANVGGERLRRVAAYSTTYFKKSVRPQVRHWRLA